jgi:hypothetical protein
VLYAILVIEGADRVLYNALARRLSKTRRALPAARVAPTPSAQPHAASLSGETA